MEKSKASSAMLRLPSTLGTYSGIDTAVALSLHPSYMFVFSVNAVRLAGHPLELLNFTALLNTSLVQAHISKTGLLLLWW